jgi:hypothetical protein
LEKQKAITSIKKLKRKRHSNMRAMVPVPMGTIIGTNARLRLPQNR